MTVTDFAEIERRLRGLIAQGRIELAKGCNLSNHTTLNAIAHDDEAYETLLEWIDADERRREREGSPS